jgi:hypothetical protein
MKIALLVWNSARDEMKIALLVWNSARDEMKTALLFLTLHGMK